MNCHFCKEETDTKKTQVLLELGHEVSVPLTMSVKTCHICTVILETTGIPKVKGTKWVLAS